jgi:hypothetical protein
METKTDYALNLYLNPAYNRLTLYAFEDHPEAGLMSDQIQKRLDLNLDEQGDWETINYLLKAEGINQDNFHDNYLDIDEWFCPCDFDKRSDTPQVIKTWLDELAEGNLN